MYIPMQTHSVLFFFSFFFYSLCAICVNAANIQIFNTFFSRYWSEHSEYFYFLSSLRRKIKVVQDTFSTKFRIHTIFFFISLISCRTQCLFLNVVIFFFNYHKLLFLVFVIIVFPCLFPFDTFPNVLIEFQRAIRECFSRVPFLPFLAVAVYLDAIRKLFLSNYTIIWPEMQTPPKPHWESDYSLISSVTVRCPLR